MKTLLASIALLLLAACAQLQPVADAVSTPQALAGCAAADVLTTAAVVSTGHGVEANPLLAPAVNAHHFLPMVLSKFAIVGVIWWLYDHFHESKAMKVGVGVATVVTCGAAIHNAMLLIP